MTTGTKMKTIIPRSVIRVAIFLIVSGSIACSSLYSQTFQDDSLRANYLINFLDFVRWDEKQNDETVIGVIGSPQVLAQLKLVAEAKRSKGKKIRVFKISHAEPIENCDLVYIGKDQSNSWYDIIEQSKLNSIVTVGEDEGFLDAGGLIEFVVIKNRLRFTLNLDVALQYRLGLSSKLAQLSFRE